VKAYRIYIVSPDGRLRLGEAFEAADDQLAGARAEALVSGGDIAELWEGGRMVGQVAEGGQFTPGTP
jgi:hypothetical protein